MTNKKSAAVTLVLCFASLVLFVGAVEVALRIQQRIGPYYDLERVSLPAPLNNPSNLVSHVCQGPLPGGAKFDRLGVRVNTKRPGYDKGAGPRLLFLGNSFMVGLGEESTIPQFLWSRFQTTLPENELFLLNAGCPSYSVTSYLLQAKYLLEELRPKVLVVNIDESDLANDVYSNARVVKDYVGNIVALRTSPRAEVMSRLNHSIKNSDLYLERLAKRLFVSYAILPQLDKSGTSEDGLVERDLFFVSRENEEESRRVYASQISLFEQRLRELAKNIKSSKKPPEKVVFSTHAHLNHFVHREGEPKWNRVIASTVGAVAEAEGFLFYDGYKDMNETFSDNPQDYYVPAERLLNEKGLSVYANGLATFMETEVFSTNSNLKHVSE